NPAVYGRLRGVIFTPGFDRPTRMDLRAECAGMQHLLYVAWVRGLFGTRRSSLGPPGVLDIHCGAHYPEYRHGNQFSPLRMTRNMRFASAGLCGIIFVAPATSRRFTSCTFMRPSIGMMLRLMRLW